VSLDFVREILAQMEADDRPRHSNHNPPRRPPSPWRDGDGRPRTPPPLRRRPLVRRRVVSATLTGDRLVWRTRQGAASGARLCHPRTRRNCGRSGAGWRGERSTGPNPARVRSSQRSPTRGLGLARWSPTFRKSSHEATAAAIEMSPTERATTTGIIDPPVQRI
jgi:hypothetical protein